MASANSDNDNGSDHHDKLLNININIALSSVERDLELHNLETYLKAYQENNNNLKMTVKLLEATFEKKIVKNNYLAQNLQLVEDNLQLWKTLVQEVQEKTDLTMDVQRLENQKDQQNQERGNAIMKRLQNVLKDKVEILEMKPLAQKRRKLIIKNQKMKIKIAILKQSIADQKEKNKAIRNIRKKKEQIKIIKFAKMMVENKQKQKLKDEKKILKSIEKNQIDEKKVLNNAEVSKAKLITFEDSDFCDEPMQIDTSKYQSELLDVSKRLQKLSAKQNSPEITKNNFVIPEIKSSFLGLGNKILDSLKNNPMFNNTIAALKLSKNQINSSEDNSPSNTLKLKPQLLESANHRKQLEKQYNLPKNFNFSPPSTLQKKSSISSINVLTQQKRATQNFLDQLAPPIKKPKFIFSQDGQPGQNIKENITNNLSQNTQKNLTPKQINLPSILSPKVTQKTVTKNLPQNSNSFLSSPITIQRSQPTSNLQVNTADDVQKQVTLDVEVPEASGPVIKSSYFPSQTDDGNLNNSTSDKVSSQLIPSNDSTQNSEKFRLSSDLENQQNSGQQSAVVEYEDEAVNMGNDDFLLENPHTTKYDYGLDVNGIDLEMPNFSPYVSPTHSNIGEDEKQENTSNENNSGFMFSFGKPQKSSSFFNMF